MKRKYKPILKNKYKYKRLHPVRTVTKVLIAILLTLYTSFIGLNTVKPYVESISISSNMNYYGASKYYVGKSLFNLGYVKFTPKNKGNVRVVVTDKIDDRYYEQFKIYYDYLNSIFEVINPKYHFELSRGDSNYDILIDSASFSQDSRFSNESSSTAAINKNTMSHLELSNVSKSYICFNSDMDLPNARVRYFLAHEMMHALLGSLDVGLGKDLPATVFGYSSATRLTYYLSNYNELDNDEENQKIRDEFMAYFPYDLSAIISVYAKKGNREECTKLLNETLEQCKKVFGDDLKYFPDGYQLPKSNDDELSR